MVLRQFANDIQSGITLLVVSFYLTCYLSSKLQSFSVVVLLAMRRRVLIGNKRVTYPVQRTVPTAAILRAWTQ